LGGNHFGWGPPWLGDAGRAPFLVIPWHLPYKWGKARKTSVRVESVWTARSCRADLLHELSLSFVDIWSRGSSVSVWLQAGRPGDHCSIPDRDKIFSCSSVSRPGLWPTQPAVQWVPGVLSPGVKRDRSVTLTTHPHPVPRWRTRSSSSSPPRRLHGLGDSFTLFIYI
jgi:hypothetical protein